MINIYIGLCMLEMLYHQTRWVKSRHFDCFPFKLTVNNMERDLLETFKTICNNISCLEPINPSVLRDRRRRRHNSASTSEEAKNAASVSGILAPISRKEPFNQEDNQQNGEVFVDRESSMRKKRLPRRHTPEPGK